MQLYLIAITEDIANPLQYANETSSRLCDSEWVIFEFYGDAKDYVQEELLRIDNPAITYSIIPFDTNDATIAQLTTSVTFDERPD